MKTYTKLTKLFLSICVLMCTQFFAQNITKPKKGHALSKAAKIYDSRYNGGKPLSKKDNALERARYEFERTKNPTTGDIPDQIREKELAFATDLPKDADQQKLVAQHQSKSSKGPVLEYWKNRGPYNVGGRTRALAIDRSNENVLLAGGVSGGLWRSEDGGNSWFKITGNDQSPSISCIVQDPRPGRENVWYYGSGELIFNSAGYIDEDDNRFNGGPFYGSGIYKSNNGGRSFQLLESTDDGDISVASPFDLINGLAIHPDSGDLYAATHQGIFKSIDEGNSFINVLPAGTERSTEVGIAPDRKIYATIDSDGDPNKGIFVSTDGNTWTDINFSEGSRSYGRTIMAFDNNQPSIVYFYRANTSSRLGLLRYDSSLPEDSEERFLPLSRTAYLEASTQGGYDMTLDVHPVHSNILFIGGTELFRSNTAFMDPDEDLVKIGGYNEGSGGFNEKFEIALDFYTNHHPDQHQLVFFPSNPNKALSANDGGVFVTENILEENVRDIGEGETVSWQSLNNGYLTTQPYSVSFDPNSTNSDLLAGFQDNGTWFTNSDNPQDAWEEDLGGDGNYSAIADHGRTRYVSFQHGGVYRLNFDEQNNFITYASVVPIESRFGEFPFVTVFTLDPNNDNIMYLPGDSGIWRNDNLDQIETMSFAGTEKNWTLIPKPDLDFLESISALDVSKYPVANRLYFGTNQGKIFKIENALFEDQEIINIWEGKGLPEDAYVNDIAVDPSNADRVIVVFSNYGIPSVFLTDDAGETWVDISGNLEENPDGSGNGPSVRCAGFFGSGQGLRQKGSQQIYVGTSTGLYRARNARENATRWRREPFVLGNTVVDELAIRKDGFIATASHGNGLSSARFPILDSLPESNLKVGFLIDDQEIRKELTRSAIDIQGLFISENDDPFDIEIYIEDTNLIPTAVIENDSLILTHPLGIDGNSFIGLTAISGIEKVSEGFHVNLSDAVVHQRDDTIGDIFSTLNTSTNVLSESADDFSVPKGQSWTLNKITGLGVGNSSNEEGFYFVLIYKDNQGEPGEEIGFASRVGELTNNVTVNFDTPVPLTEGKYWVSVYAVIDSGGWFWKTQKNTNGLESLSRNDVFNNPDAEWTPVSAVLQSPVPTDQIFTLFGDIQYIDPNEDLKNPSETEELALNVYPNPSKNRFTVPLSVFTEGNPLSVKVTNVVGQVVYQEILDNKTNTFVWNADDQDPGFYTITIQDEALKRSLKVIKQ